MVVMHACIRGCLLVAGATAASSSPAGGDACDASSDGMVWKVSGLSGFFCAAECAC